MASRQAEKPPSGKMQKHGMVTERKLMLRMGIFMLPLGIVYWFTSYEVAGSIMLLMVALAFVFMGVYLAVQSARTQGPRPEDYDANPSDGEGEVGSFPAASIWPFLGAIGLMLVAYGLVFTTFLAVPGLGLILLTVIGMARESEISELHLLELSHAPPGGPDATGTQSFSDQVAK